MSNHPNHQCFFPPRRFSGSYMLFIESACILQLVGLYSFDATLRHRGGFNIAMLRHPLAVVVGFCLTMFYHVSSCKRLRLRSIKTHTHTHTPAFVKYPFIILLFWDSFSCIGHEDDRTHALAPPNAETLRLRRCLWRALPGHKIFADRQTDRVR